MKAAGHGIIEFEVTFDPAASTRIVEDWKEGDALDEAVLSIEVDFTFLGAYSLLAGSLVLWTARRAEGAWRTRGFALVPWCAAMGLFDAVENCLGLVTLHAGRGDAMRSPLMTLFASGKLVVLGLALAYVVRGLVARRATK
jgi:hypothetical protein